MNIKLVFSIHFMIILRTIINGNICSYTDNAESICCEGWVKNVYGDCIKSDCFQDCGYGKCVGFNICECFDGTTRSDACPPFKQRTCPNDCSNRGKCQDWKCICDSGFSGVDCNTTLVSTCYINVNRGLCKSTPESLQLTREECCSIFQMAWGNPCQFCKRMNNCEKGFISKNGVCEDIDECQFNGICLNGQCVNERGSFKCQCPPQYVLNENTMACQQFKEVCDVYGSNCGLYGRCIPLITGEYKCICREPYESSEDGKKCIRRKAYNVCKMFSNLCQPDGECQPIALSYNCKCRNGFVQSHDKKSCRINLSPPITNNDDLCRNPEVSQKCINGQCIPDSATYKCECYPPYKASPDLQECILNQIVTPSVRGYCQRSEYYSLCQGGQCVDVYNGYYCNCINGYVAVENSKRCEKYDRNENQGRTPGASSHYCRDKFYFSRCNGGRCIGDPSYGFKCICLPGFVEAADGRACHPVKINQCSINGHRCLPGSCESLGEDDFQCNCPTNFIRSTDGRSCSLNIISTRATTTYCDIPSYRERCATGKCIPDNNFGFKCICDIGYKATEDGRACEQIKLSDPCQNYGSNCSPGRCRNVGISDFQCDCPAYLVQSTDGRSCLKSNQITSLTSNYCDILTYKERCLPGECIPDKYYGFKCICSVGYNLAEDGRACLKNENPESICIKHQSNCRGGLCIERSYGDYECQCGQGYSKSNDGRSCFKSSQTICGRYGSRCLTGVCFPRGEEDYMCLCANGYSPTDDSKACEKQNRESVCQKYQPNCNGGRCIEYENSDYKCICLQGYHKSDDQRSCIKDVQSMCDIYGSRCLNGVCYSRGDQDYFCLCATGYSPTEDSKACVQKTMNSQCAINGHLCKGNLCIDRGDDYKCLCLNGYITSDDQRSCEKSTVKEKCSQYKSRCRDGFCFDVQQGYLCVCSSSYMVSEDGRYCNENEMIVFKTNNFIESPLIGLEETKHCSSKFSKEWCYPGTCINVPNSYTCACPYSFKISFSGRQCIRDQSKCPSCYYGCTNVEWESKCLCPIEYKDFLNTSLCIKIQDSLEYSLVESFCHSEIKGNRTFAVKFKGVSSKKNYTSETIYNNVNNILQQRQFRGSKINFCVPDHKPYNSGKMVKKYISPNLYLWRAVCIFDC